MVGRLASIEHRGELLRHARANGLDHSLNPRLRSIFIAVAIAGISSGFGVYQRTSFTNR